MQGFGTRGSGFSRDGRGRRGMARASRLKPLPQASRGRKGRYR